MTDHNDKSLYRIGGVSALTLGAAYLATIPLYIAGGTPPEGAEAWLRYVDGKQGLWWGILGLSVLTDFLFIPVVMAIYAALKHTHRALILLGAGFVTLFAVLDLAVTWPNYAALIRLGGQYAAATSKAGRASIIAAVTYAQAVLPYSLIVNSIFVPSLGIFLAGIAMLRSGFSRGAAYTGIATGIFGVISVVGPLVAKELGMAIFLTSILTIAWLGFVGLRLLRMGSQAD